MNNINEKNFKPLRALILVRRDDPESEDGGIIIPDSVQTYGWRATVIRSGPKASDYRAGDVILFQKEFTVLPFEDRTLALTEAEHVLAKLKVIDNAECIIPQNKFVLVDPSSMPNKVKGLFLADKSKPLPKTGCVKMAGTDCREVKIGMDIWFEGNVGVNCVEDGEGYKLIDESNILAMRNGDET